MEEGRELEADIAFLRDCLDGEHEYRHVLLARSTAGEVPSLQVGEYCLFAGGWTPTLPACVVSFWFGLFTPVQALRDCRAQLERDLLQQPPSRLASEWNFESSLKCSSHKWCISVPVNTERSRRDPHTSVSGVEHYHRRRRGLSLPQPADRSCGVCLPSHSIGRRAHHRRRGSHGSDAWAMYSPSH